MKIGIIVGVLITAVFAAVITTSKVTEVVTDHMEAQAGGVVKTSCDASIGPTLPGQVDRGSSDVNKLDEEQKGIVALIISIGKQRTLSPRAWQVAI